VLALQRGGADVRGVETLRAYVHDDGSYFSLCPDDGRGDVVLQMPVFHPDPNSDYNRLARAIAILAGEVAPEEGQQP
jgi:hypothetical protein